jgi:hypothetical protein
VLAFLLLLTATSALADIGLVADLDGNYQNGPDTLQIEPADTVLVHVWITGQGDSLIGFGITIGDSSGALVWVEEDPDSIYTIPSGWTNPAGLVDALGRVLIQGVDFSFSVPIVLPSQVAELKFTVAPGESCGTIGWDPEMSGWQDWGFRDGLFTSGPQEPVSIGDWPSGGCSGPSDSGGDNASSDDSDDQPGGGDSFDEGPTEFTRSFRVPEEDYLFIHGYRVSGKVDCTWTVGGPLLINDYQVLPQPKIVGLLSEKCEGGVRV